MQLFAMRMTLLEPATFGEIEIVDNLLKRLPRHEYFARLGNPEFMQKLLPRLTPEGLRDGVPPL